METLIDLRNLSRVFGNYQALCDVTLQLQPGRIGLLGPNGAPWTTETFQSVMKTLGE